MAQHQRDDDLVREIVATDRQLTIAAMQGNAGAGGVFLALAADRVWARDGVILNPHYKAMGNLYGSEYWTYLLPRRVGARPARRRSRRAGCRSARARRAAIGLDRRAISARRRAAFRRRSPRARARSPPIPRFARCSSPSAMRAGSADEAAKPLAAYRAEELARMRLNFFGFDSSYHVARYHFVAKVPRSRTPLWLARHRRACARAVAA